MRGCPVEVGRLLASIAMFSVIAAAVLLVGRVGSEGWHMEPGRSLLGGIVFLGCAVLLALCGRAASRERPRRRSPAIYTIDELERGNLSRGRVPFASVPGGCAILAALPGVLVLTLLGLLFLANSVALRVFGANIASWLFTPLH